MIDVATQFFDAVRLLEHQSFVHCVGVPTYLYFVKNSDVAFGIPTAEPNQLPTKYRAKRQIKGIKVGLRVKYLLDIFGQFVRYYLIIVHRQYPVVFGLLVAVVFLFGIPRPSFFKYPRPVRLRYFYCLVAAARIYHHHVVGQVAQSSNRTANFGSTVAGNNHRRKRKIHEPKYVN